MDNWVLMDMAGHRRPGTEVKRYDPHAPKAPHPPMGEIIKLAPKEKRDMRGKYRRWGGKN